jgi:aspartyl-tRNA(Asn)/glutamyl-tRNA(Gln) amidotransferase subunit C
MRLSREEVLHIASLCRIGLSEEDLERMQDQLSNILQQFDVLKQVDTAEVPPTAHSIDLESVLREDASKPSLSRDEVLMNAPQREDQYLRVKAILGD